MKFILFDFLNDCDNEDTLRCCELIERLYHISSKTQHATQTRKFLEAFFRMVCNEQRKELPSKDQIHEIELSNIIHKALNAQLINKCTKPDMDKSVFCEYKCILDLKGYGNSGAHLVSLSEDDKKCYEMYNKQTAMADLYAVTKNIYTRWYNNNDTDINIPQFVRPSLRRDKTPYIEIEHKLNTIPFYSYTGGMYSFEKTLNKHYKHYLCHEVDPLTGLNIPNNTIVRIIEDPSDSREQIIQKIISSHQNLKDHILLSENLHYEKELFQILALTLQDNQCTLRDYIRKHSPISASEALKITYAVINVLTDLYELPNHNICHRNINPDTIIIETDENGNFSKAMLSCFDHAKIHNCTITVTEKQAQHPYHTKFSIDNIFVYPELSKLYSSNKDNIPSIPIAKSRYLDAYSISVLLIFLVANMNPDEDKLTDKDLSDNIKIFSQSPLDTNFKQHIIDFLAARKIEKENDECICNNAAKLGHLIGNEHERINPVEIQDPVVENEIQQPTKRRIRESEISEMKNKIEILEKEYNELKKALEIQRKRSIVFNACFGMALIVLLIIIIFLLNQ